MAKEMHYILNFSLVNTWKWTQISDFGLAKWLPDQWTHHTVSKFEGTFGFVDWNFLLWNFEILLLQAWLSSCVSSDEYRYLPPEFFMHGIVDEKTDVYAYGVLLLELITGRRALDSSQQSLVMWVRPLLQPQFCWSWGQFCLLKLVCFKTICRLNLYF